MMGISSPQAFFTLIFESSSSVLCRESETMPWPRQTLDGLEDETPLDQEDASGSYKKIYPSIYLYAFCPKELVSLSVLL